MSLRSIGRKCRQKCCSEASIRSVEQKCCSEALLRSVAQTCPSEITRTVDQIRSVDQTRCSESEVSLKSVAQKRQSKSVAQKCGAELLLGSFDQKCAQKVLLRVLLIAQRRRSEVSLRSVAHVTRK